MPNPQPKTEANRLLDIIVEEVSLVDRAANKRRFLIVKRSEPDMADENTSTSSTSAEGASGKAPESPSNLVEEPAPLLSTSDPLLATAVSALEGLTSTVELLNTVGGAADPRFAPLAEELKTTAHQLLERAGLSEAPEEPKEPAPDDAFTRNIAAAREAIARLTDLSTQKAEENTAESAPSPVPPLAPTPAPVAPAAPSPLESIAEALGTLTGSFKALSEAVKEQQQRLSLLEKNVGLPNSSQSPESVTKSEPEDTAWPLDMNHPMDRESVDKSVSFHDL